MGIHFSDSFRGIIGLSFEPKFVHVGCLFI